jgi:hypothetical protein
MLGSKQQHCNVKMQITLSWRRGIVAIVFAYRTEDPGFEALQGASLLYIAVLLS